MIYTAKKYFKVYNEFTVKIEKKFFNMRYELNVLKDMLPAEYRISFSFQATREHQNIQIRNENWVSFIFIKTKICY